MKEYIVWPISRELGKFAVVELAGFSQKREVFWGTEEQCRVKARKITRGMARALALIRGAA